MNYWGGGGGGGGGGGKGYVAPLSNYWGGEAGPPLPTPMRMNSNTISSVEFSPSKYLSILVKEIFYFTFRVKTYCR